MGNQKSICKNCQNDKCSQCESKWSCNCECNINGLADSVQKVAVTVSGVA